MLGIFDFNMSYVIAIILWLVILISFSYWKKVNLKKGYFVTGFLLLTYLWLTLSSVTGFPTINEWKRLAGVGESIWQPILSLKPFTDISDFSFRANIIWFVPLGILLVMMSKAYQRLLPTLLTGFLFSLTIEVAQLFMIWRITDIDDLFANVAGTLIGWGIAKSLKKFRLFQPKLESDHSLFLVWQPIFLFYLVAIVIFIFTPGIDFYIN